VDGVTRGGAGAGNVGGEAPGDGNAGRVGAGVGGVGAVTGGAGAVAHPTSSEATAKLQWRNQHRDPIMWLILLEAALAGALLLFIVWWTMFDKPKKKD